MLRKLLSNKIIKFFIGILEVLLFGGLIIYVGFVMMQRFSGNSSIGGYRVFTVATESMMPVYNVNDVILVHDIKPDDLKVGRDVVYLGTRGGLEGLMVVHRIIKIEKDTQGKLRIFTQGVNNENPDPSITEDQLIGSVSRKLYSITFINNIVKNQYGFFFLIFCPFVLVIMVEIFQSILEMKYGKEEEEEKAEVIDCNEEVEVLDEKEQ